MTSGTLERSHVGEQGSVCLRIRQLFLCIVAALCSGAQLVEWSMGWSSPVLVPLARQPLGSEQLTQLCAVGLD